MTNSIRARADERPAWIRRGWDRAIPGRFEVETAVDGFDVYLTVVVGARGPQAVSVTVEQPQGGHGAGVTLTVLRKVTVDQIIRDGVAQLERRAWSAEAETGIRGTYRVEGDDRVFADGGFGVPDAGRGRDTPADRLQEVARVYLAAVKAGRPPVMAVASDLNFSRSTAGRLVGDARKAGLLRPTTQGRTSDAPDDPAHVSQAKPDPMPPIFLDPSKPRPWEGNR